ncbi:hypothetical protein ICC18_00100 [Paenibacillus sp. WST5]|uniref:Uncharacterized protein n=1 Tax=Paenibacillus sedimenti TaxID=2770274 RepID=A0A926QHH5_9BACL|nr:hypothetical protein [Paenibacillus sedimenti]
MKDGVTGGTGETNFFVRDPFFTIGNHMIEAPFRSPWRRLEVLTVRDIINKEIAKRFESVFLSIVLLGIRSSLVYLRKINDEIHILEGGELEYTMTIQGYDEVCGK